MTGHGAKFGRKQEAAILALLTQKNTEEAAYHSREASRHVNPEAAIAHSHLIVPSHHQ